MEPESERGESRGRCANPALSTSHSFAGRALGPFQKLTLLSGPPGRSDVQTAGKCRQREAQTLETHGTLTGPERPTARSEGIVRYVYLPSFLKMTAKPQKSAAPEKIKLAPMNAVNQPYRGSTVIARMLLPNTSIPFAISALRSTDIGF